MFNRLNPHLPFTSIYSYHLQISDLIYYCRFLKYTNKKNVS